MVGTEEHILFSPSAEYIFITFSGYQHVSAAALHMLESVFRLTLRFITHFLSVTPSVIRSWASVRFDPGCCSSVSSRLQWWRWIKDTHSLCKVRLKSCMLCKVRLMLWPTTSICFPAVNLHARSDIRFVHRCRSATWCVRAGRWRSLAVSEIYGGDVFFVFSLGVTFWCPIRHILWCSR